jgi:hypothetical protein
MSRASCIDCSRKHVSQAEVLMEESKQGYPMHRWLAIGHLAEASAELLEEHPDMADFIRQERLKYMDDEEYGVATVAILEQLTELDGADEEEPSDDAGSE